MKKRIVSGEREKGVCSKSLNSQLAAASSNNVMANDWGQNDRNGMRVVQEKTKWIIQANVATRMQSSCLHMSLLFIWNLLLFFLLFFFFHAETVHKMGRVPKGSKQFGSDQQSCSR